MQDNILIENEKEKFIYQKKDFVNIGIKQGSFDKLIKDLNIDNENYMMRKQLRNGISAKFFNQEAYDIVLNYIKAKNDSHASQAQVSLSLKNKELEEQNIKLKATLAIIENEYNKKISEISEKNIKIEKELEIIKLEHKNEIFQLQQEKEKNEWKLNNELQKKEMEMEELQNRGLIARILNKKIKKL